MLQSAVADTAGCFPKANSMVVSSGCQDNLHQCVTLIARWSKIVAIYHPWLTCEVMSAQGSRSGVYDACLTCHSALETPKSCKPGNNPTTSQAAYGGLQSPVANPECAKARLDASAQGLSRASARARLGVRHLSRAQNFMFQFIGFRAHAWEHRLCTLSNLTHAYMPIIKPLQSSI